MIDWNYLGDILQALILALTLGGLIGFEREMADRWAGLRTHMLVSLGSAIFVLLGRDFTENNPAEITRVIQGVAAGVGFIGAGTILKLSEKMEVRGLTTASSVWLSAAVGVACGLNRFTLAVVGTLLTLIVLFVLRRIEKNLLE